MVDIGNRIWYGYRACDVAADALSSDALLQIRVQCKGSDARTERGLDVCDMTRRCQDWFHTLSSLVALIVLHFDLASL